MNADETARQCDRPGTRCERQRLVLLKQEPRQRLAVLEVALRLIQSCKNACIMMRSAQKAEPLLDARNCFTTKHLMLHPEAHRQEVGPIRRGRRCDGGDPNRG